MRFETGTSWSFTTADRTVSPEDPARLRLFLAAVRPTVSTMALPCRFSRSYARGSAKRFGNFGAIAHEFQRIVDGFARHYACSHDPPPETPKTRWTHGQSGLFSLCCAERNGQTGDVSVSRTFRPEGLLCPDRRRRGDAAMSIEQRFDVPFVARMSLREKQIQQNYRPIIGVHKWFARRPGTLFRGLLLSEFTADCLQQAFFRPHGFPGVKIADPFMGGGTPLIEANRVGCDVEGFDINPMSAWIVREEISHLNLDVYRRSANGLLAALRAEVDGYYRTTCPLYGDDDVPVKSFLWVKVRDCEACGRSFDLFPGYVLAENRRHPKPVLICPMCGELNEAECRESPGNCTACGTTLLRRGPARRGRCNCPHCGHTNAYPGKTGKPPAHRLFAIEYYNPQRKAEHRGRFFKKPDAEDLARAASAAKRWRRMTARFVPDETIPAGDETARLSRWGYSRYREMFSPRQLLGLELSCRLVAATDDERVRRALATNLSDLLRYQNMLCRYDQTALKALDIFSVHGFPVSLVQCESNMLGIVSRTGANVGSGGWSNIVDKYVRAKRYCEAPYEVQEVGSRKIRAPIEGERIGERLNGVRRRVAIHCKDAAGIELAAHSLDAVLTDPPYFGNVQYAELMDFCYVWLRRLADKNTDGFERPLTRSPAELTGNITQARGLEHFTEGLSKVYRQMARALKPGAPLVFTYHHNQLDAYCAVGVAVLDAGLVCSASLPCPSEMRSSIHIHGTASSIVDTVFVCRSTGEIPEAWLFDSSERLVEIVSDDLAKLSAAGRQATRGDTRCIVFGHLTRMAVWNLRTVWNRSMPTSQKIAAFRRWIVGFGDPEAIALTATAADWQDDLPLFTPGMVAPETGARDAVSF